MAVCHSSQWPVRRRGTCGVTSQVQTLEKEQDALERRHDTPSTGGRCQGRRWQNRLLRRVDRLHRIGGKKLCGTSFLGEMSICEDDVTVKPAGDVGQLGAQRNGGPRENCVFSAHARAHSSCSCARSGGARGLRRRDGEERRRNDYA